MYYKRSLCWFRRDLRLEDHTALAAAMEQSEEVIGVFIFDTTILELLPPDDRRVAFIWDSLKALYDEFARHEGAFYVLHGDPVIEIPRLAYALNGEAVFTHRDVEPSANQRDERVQQALQGMSKAFHSFKDQMIFEKGEVLTQVGTSFSVFTPYKQAWLRRLQEHDRQTQPSVSGVVKLKTVCKAPKMPDLEGLGFGLAQYNRMKLEAGSIGASALLNDFLQRIDQYGVQRDFPAVKGVSYLSVHLRFGTLSIREAVRHAYSRMVLGSKGAEVWLSELIWREFYMDILAHHPHVQTQPFKREYQHLVFENNEAWFDAWKTGQTGYPIVDAAMRQLNQTGYMHNRLRMIAASFLVKDLQIDWRWGERYFAEHLNDFDLAANNGGWQWCASTGCDAQPYFRIFNPITQSEKFDPEGVFIRKYIPELRVCTPKQIHSPWRFPELSLKDYPLPIVDHASARLKTLERYKAVLQKSRTV
jgi:deoxyribodipyrimidine photo-lyase